jgi:probable phosphoglycerate mutase
LSALASRLFLVRHGETAWSLSGQHTGRTDIPLTENGKKQAAALTTWLHAPRFSKAFTSPLSRARETARLAGFPDATVCDELAEFDYGAYEGMTSMEIRMKVPGWTLWTRDCPQGETLDAAAARAQRAIDMASKVEGDVIFFSHGHILRILASAWLKQPPTSGQFFMLDPSSISVLSHEREIPAIRLWNFAAADGRLRIDFDQ